MAQLYLLHEICTNKTVVYKWELTIYRQQQETPKKKYHSKITSYEYKCKSTYNKFNFFISITDAPHKRIAIVWFCSNAAFFRLLYNRANRNAVLVSMRTAKEINFNDIYSRAENCQVAYLHAHSIRWFCCCCCYNFSLLYANKLDAVNKSCQFK